MLLMGLGFIGVKTSWWLALHIDAGASLTMLWLRFGLVVLAGLLWVCTAMLGACLRIVQDLDSQGASATGLASSIHPHPSSLPQTREGHAGSLSRSPVGEGWGRSRVFEPRAPTLRSGLGLQAQTRTASEERPADWLNIVANQLQEWAQPRTLVNFALMA